MYFTYGRSTPGGVAYTTSPLPEGLSGQAYANTLGIPATDWVEFDIDAQPANEHWFLTAFYVIDNQPETNDVGFNFSQAQSQALALQKGQTTEALQTIRTVFPPETLAAQASLTPAAREPEYQTALDDTNTILLTNKDNMALILAASTPTQLAQILGYIPSGGGGSSHSA